VRRSRGDLMEQRLSDLPLVDPDHVPTCGLVLPELRQGSTKKALILSDLAPHLQSLDR
jgi:hypothetical protein